MRCKLDICWQETATELKELYRQERNVERHIRLQALWHLRSGKKMQEVTESGDSD